MSAGSFRPERTGPLTWVQQEWLPEQPDAREFSHEDNMFRRLDFPPMPPDRVRLAVRQVLARHEQLRSRLVGLGEDARQVVDAVEPGCDLVLDTVAPESWDLAVTAARRTNFRLSREWPLKLVADHGPDGVTRLAMVVDHCAADGLGVLALYDDLAGALAAAAAGTEWVPAGPVEQPIDLALWESASRGGAAYLRRVLSHRRQQYERLRSGVGEYRPARAAAGGAEGLRFPGCTLSSVRLAKAAQAVADRTEVPVSAVYLAAFATALGAAEQVGTVGVLMLSANRLTPAALRSVRNAVVAVPVVLDVPPAGAFADAVTEAAGEQLRGMRYANADQRLTGALADEILGDLRTSAVASAIYNFMPESALRGEGVPAVVRDAPLDVVEPMPVRDTAAERMFMVTLRQDRVILTMRWREDNTWQRFAEPMLRYMADLILHEAAPGTDAPVFHA